MVRFFTTGVQGRTRSELECSLHLGSGTFLFYPVFSVPPSLRAMPAHAPLMFRKGFLGGVFLIGFFTRNESFSIHDLRITLSMSVYRADHLQWVSVLKE